MLGWLFKKKPPPADGASAPAAPAAPARSPRGAQPETAPAPAPAPPEVDWAARLQQATGDDAALLEIAGAAAPLAVREAAIGAIASEAVLKSAERSFRDRDRRIARLAKQRHAERVAQRESRAEADRLIAAAQALAGAALIPVNRLGELDRAWQALEPARLEAAQRDAFAAAMTQLSTLIRERGDATLKAERWTSGARTTLAALHAASAAAAEGSGERSALAGALEAAHAAIAAADAGIDAELRAALVAAIEDAQRVDARVAFLERLRAGVDGAGLEEQAAADAPAPATDEPAVGAVAPGSQTALSPATAEPASPQRVEAPSSAQPAPLATDAPAAAAAAPGSQTALTPATPEQASSGPVAVPSGAEPGPLATDAPAADAAGPGPQPAPTAATSEQAWPQAVEAPSAPAPPRPALHAAGTPATTAEDPDAAPSAAGVATRITAPTPESRWRALPLPADARLHDSLERRFEAWRQTRADARQVERTRRAEQTKTQQRVTRDVQTAALDAALDAAEQALADGQVEAARGHLGNFDSLAAQGGLGERQRARSGALHAELARLKGWQQWGGAVARDELMAEAEALAAGDAATATLPVKQRAERIASLRARWKELDRLGSPGSAAAWRRFDEALSTAHRPVAEHAAAQRAARAQNLQSRLELLDALDAVRLPGESEAREGLATASALAADAQASADASRRPDAAGEPIASASAADADPARTASADAAGGNAASARPDDGVAPARRAAEAGAAPAGSTPTAAALDAPPAATSGEGAGVSPALDADPATSTPRRADSQAAERDAARSATDLAGTPAERAASEPAAQMAPADSAAAAPGSSAPTVPDWRGVVQALDRFRAAWRTLGPLEHTVPRAEREPLVERMQRSLDRLEAPLGAAREAARRSREQLVERARALADEAASGRGGRDLAGRVRELQASWQQQARTVPLPRAVENAAWADFRAAVDAVFRARDAVFDARDAALQAHAAERRAVIERLEAHAAAAGGTDLRREIAAADTAWERIGPAPRDAAAALDAAFRAARDAATRALAETEAAERRRATEALHAKLALCEAIEGAEPDLDRDTLAERWNAWPALAPAWERALQQRAGLATPGRETAAGALGVDELLLQLEAALGLASPPALQEARRALKLQAMKAALEGRGAPPAQPSRDEAVAALLGRRGLDAAQRQRLQRALDALLETAPAAPARTR